MQAGRRGEARERDVAELRQMVEGRPDSVGDMLARYAQQPSRTGSQSRGRPRSSPERNAVVHADVHTGAVSFSAAGHAATRSAGVADGSGDRGDVAAHAGAVHGDRAPVGAVESVLEPAPSTSGGASTNPFVENCDLDPSNPFYEGPANESVETIELESMAARLFDVDGVEGESRVGAGDRVEPVRRSTRESAPPIRYSPPPIRKEKGKGKNTKKQN